MRFDEGYGSLRPNVDDTTETERSCHGDHPEEFSQATG